MKVFLVVVTLIIAASSPFTENLPLRDVFGIATALTNGCTSGQNGASVCSGDSGGRFAVEGLSCSIHTMKVILVAVALAIAASAAFAYDLKSESITAYNYHKKVGIPKAQLMRRSEENPEARIIKGEVTDVSEVPYQVGLIMRVLYIFESVCGGSLISPTAVITAAHCDNDGLITAQSYTVVLGSNTLFSGGQRYTTTDVSVHPEWFPLLARNDICVLRIPPQTLSDVIQPIALPSGDNLGNSWVGEIALASGFGLTADGSNIAPTQVISSVNLDIVANSVCVDVYGIATVSTNICTKGQNGASVCSGDSGGPLVVKSNGIPTLVGVTSYGHRDGCEIGHPNAFSRITSYLDWIKSVA